MADEEDDMADIFKDDDDINFDSSNLGLGDFSDFSDNTNMQKHADLLKELTNFDPIIQRRIRNWLGLEWDSKIKGYVQRKEAIINEKGAKWAIGFLETYQAKPNIITNLSQQEYKDFKVEIIDGAWLVFPTKYDEFDIKDTADQWRLSNELQHSAFLVLAGAGDGKYSKFLGESVHRTESVQLNNQQQPMGMYQQQPSSPKGWLDGIKRKILGKQ